MLLLLLLCACGAEQTSAQTPVLFRTSLLEAGTCTFTAELRADYGETVREFTLDCTCDSEGGTLTVLAPDTASGITATVSGDQAQVSFGDTVLAVENFESRRISPLGAPWLLRRAWAEGYISSVGMDGSWELVEYALGYGSEQLTITTAFSQGLPVYAEISDGKNTLISCEITALELSKKEDEEHAETDLGGDRS
jgi:hypothetical protein